MRFDFGTRLIDPTTVESIQAAAYETLQQTKAYDNYLSSRLNRNTFGSSSQSTSKPKYTVEVVAVVGAEKLIVQLCAITISYHHLNVFLIKLNFTNMDVFLNSLRT